MPVGSYESYRAEVSAVLGRLGVRRVRFVDEPVAAAIGYSLSTGKRRDVLVVDFGGGTLDLALVLLLTFFLALASAFYAAQRAASLDPIEAMQS